MVSHFRETAPFFVHNFNQLIICIRLNRIFFLMEILLLNSLIVTDSSLFLLHVFPMQQNFLMDGYYVLHSDNVRKHSTTFPIALVGVIVAQMLERYPE